MGLIAIQRGCTHVVAELFRSDLKGQMTRLELRATPVPDAGHGSPLLH